MEPVQKFITYLFNEGRVILGAPVSFVTFVLLAAIVIWVTLSWRYSGQIENLQSTIIAKQSLLSDYKDKLSGATPDEAKRRLDALELQVAALSPRRLTEKQKETITAKASVTKAHISIVSDAAVPDARAYANDLAVAFQSAGWTVTLPMGIGIGNPPMTGLALRVLNPASLRRPEMVTKAALEAINIKFDIQSGISVAPKAPPGAMVSNPWQDPDVELLITTH
jgi:hypothetical protein